MRILLVNPSDTMGEIMGGARVFVHRTEPLGLLYLAAVLEADGHEVEVLDAFALDLTLEDVQARLTPPRWDLIGVGALTSTGAWVWELAGYLAARFPEVTVVLGNVHAAEYAAFYLGHGRGDVVVHGEGELIMRDLARALADGRPLSEVRGISYREGAEIRHTGPGAVVADLDTLPLPARHLVDMDRYTWREFVSRRQAKGRYRVMSATRGCPFACTFCIVNADRNYRTRSAGRVVDELELLVRQYDASFVELLDPLFTVDKAFVKQVCQGILDRKLDVAWQCEGHVNTVDADTLRWMRRAGCVNMAFGIESGTAEILKRVRKGSSPERVRGAIAATRAAGIHPHGLFILGFPGETPAQAEATVRLALELPLEFAQFAILVPYPGSPIHRELVAAGRLGTERTPEETVASWKRYSAYLSYTDLEPMYVPDGWTAASLKAAQRSAIRRFYLRPRQIIKEIKKFRPSSWRSYVEGVRTVFLSGLADLIPRGRP